MATAGPSIPSAPLACDKHRGTNGWTIGEACEACIALAYLHSNNYEEAIILQEPERIILPSLPGASSSTCIAEEGLPDEDRDVPPPPPLSGVRSAQKREGMVVHP